MYTKNFTMKELFENNENIMALIIIFYSFFVYGLGLWLFCLLNLSPKSKVFWQA